MLRKVIAIGGVLVMLIAAVLVVPQRGKAADVDQVLVVNGPKKPVPVTGNIALSGTANVNVTNTPNVNVTALPAVQLAGGTTVGINGTPNVNVTNTPSVSVAPGTVLDVRTVNDVPQAVEAELTLPIPAGQSIGNDVVV